MTITTIGGLNMLDSPETVPWSIPILRSALERLTRFTQSSILVVTDDAEARSDGSKREHKLILKIFTEMNVYQIKAIERDEGRSYLGAQASTRAPAPGVDHAGGRDLADGLFTSETWTNILTDIVAFELKPLVVDGAMQFTPADSCGDVAQEELSEPAV